MKLMKIKVVDGKKIRHCDNARVLRPGQSYTVPETAYWLRRLKDNDVILVVPKPEKRVLKKENRKKEEVMNDNII